MKAPNESGRILKLVEEALAASPVPRHEIERRLGFRSGQLARLLGGSKPLTVELLLIILDAAAVPRADFFDRLVSPDRRTRRAGAPGVLGGVPLERWLQELRGLRCRLELTRGPVVAGRPGL